jgi:hypothetical protein
MPQAEGLVRGVIMARWSRGSFCVITPWWRGVMFPSGSGPWQTVRKRHHRFATDGTWDMDMLLRVIRSGANAADWSVSVDSSFVRAHKRSATAHRVVRGDRARLEEHIGGSVE